MKVCGRCGESKALDEFAPDRRAKSGVGRYCLPCKDERTKEQARERNRRYVAAHPERRAAGQKRWRERVGPDYWRRWREANPGKDREYQLRSLYGITVEQYDAMFEAQGGLCAICGRPGNGPLRVDHDHETNEVRGLLCHGCNVAIGLMADDPDRLIAAAAYLLAQRLKDTLDLG